MQGEHGHQKISKRPESFKLTNSEWKCSTIHPFPTSVRTWPLRKTRIICTILINKPKSAIWENRSTCLSMNSITRPRRRLHLWREKDRIRNENAEIKNLESKYLSSFEEFKNKFNSGTIPDSYTYSIETDYFEWEGLVNRLSKYNSLF